MWSIKTKQNGAGGSQRGHPRQRRNIGIWNAVRIIAFIWSHQSGNIAVNIVKHWNVWMYYPTDTWDGKISLYLVPPGGLKALVNKSAYFTASLFLYRFITRTIIFFKDLHFSHQTVPLYFFYISGSNSDKLRHSGEEPSLRPPVHPLPLGWARAASPLSGWHRGDSRHPRPLRALL